MNIFVLAEYLTETEKSEYLTAMLKRAELEVKIEFRNMEKGIEFTLHPDTSLLEETEMRAYEEAGAILRSLQEKTVDRMMKIKKQKAISLSFSFVFTPPIWICKLFKDVGLCKSLNEAKKLIKQKGLRINKKAITDVDYIVSKEDVVDGGILLQRGKKQLYRISVR